MAPWPINARRPVRRTPQPPQQQAPPSTAAEPRADLDKATAEAGSNRSAGIATTPGQSSEAHGTQTGVAPGPSLAAAANMRRLQTTSGIEETAANIAVPPSRASVDNSDDHAAASAGPTVAPATRPSLSESKTSTVSPPSPSSAPLAPASTTTEALSQAADAAPGSNSSSRNSSGLESRAQSPTPLSQKQPQDQRRPSPTRSRSVSPAASSEADTVGPWNAALDTTQDWVEDSGLPGMSFEYTQRPIQSISPSTFLRPGSKFVGTQRSERHHYDVQVEIKQVDYSRSFMCGYLRIQGLTDDHPTLTTFFEAEMIGRKRHGFVTKHDMWGASEKTDLQHWEAFPELSHYAQLAMRGPANTEAREATMQEALAKNPHMMYMRWKEHFLVPDHRVRAITGASFEGFYYISFDRRRGGISGVYFHNKSEKFQKLDLTHVADRGYRPCIEFR